MNGLSNPATTLSQSGQLLDNTFSSSVLSFSAFLPSSGSVPFRLPPPSPIPGIHPTGAVTSVTKVSGTTSSLNLSPAESILRPTTFAARALFGIGFVKLDERSARWLAG